MANADGPNSQTSKNPLRALFGRLSKPDGEEERAAPAAPPGPEEPVDMVDQAEAFKELRVEDVMTPRADIIGLDVDSQLKDVVQAFVESEHSRMPIYRETLDDPMGVVHVKDVFKLIAADHGRAPPDLGEAVLNKLKRDVLYVPASMRTADLLVKMRASRIHLALVIDEFGGTEGLVTLEDLVEAVVGEIEDEYDEQSEAAIVRRPGDVIEADARAPLEALEAEVGEQLSPADLEEEIDTVAGLVSAIAGRVPQRGEVIRHPAGFDFEVLDADPRRIKRLRVRKVERAPEPPVGNAK